ncbi:MAG: flagellar protein FlaG [Lachnospiraceae bacterium]|nr:flagellar protein FlaG [Lachnospiraceae bacterium]
MTLEPINSMMSLQAQTVNQKPVQVEKADTSAATLAHAAEPVDKTTRVVENAQSKDGNGTNAQNKEQANNEQLRKAVEKLNKSMTQSEAVFGFHEDTNRVTIKIVDKDSKEVIKELPPEKTLDMIAKVWEIAGMLVDEKR